MHFDLIDRVVERSDRSIVTLKAVTRSEEYLGDHFPSFPVLPGVFMLEAMVQAARELADPDRRSERPLVLGGVRSLKYGRFVQPGDTLRVEVQRTGDDEDAPEFKGSVLAVLHDTPDRPVAATGRFSLRPVRLESPVGG